MYNMYMDIIDYSIADFRKNMRVALDSVDAGVTVLIKRHDKEYVIKQNDVEYTAASAIPQPRKPMDIDKAGIATLCKHGAHPDFCKYKPQGKPCK